MKICTNCGIQADDNLNFCPSCGNAMVNAEEPTLDEAKDEQAFEKQTEQQSQEQFGQTGAQYYDNNPYATQPQAPFVDEEKKTVSDLSVVGFVLSLTLSGFTGAVLGIIDLAKNKKNKRGLSIAAIIIGAVKFVASIALTVVLITSISTYIKSYTNQNSSSAQNPYYSNPYQYELPDSYDDWDDWEDFFNGGNFNFGY